MQDDELVVAFLDMVENHKMVVENSGLLTDDIITVQDDELVVAFLDMVENHKMVVENSGLLTVAALKQLDVSDKRVVSIVSGGNMDVITMSSVVQQLAAAIWMSSRCPPLCSRD